MNRDVILDKSYQVCELNSEDMLNINGGSALAWFLAGILVTCIFDAIDNPDAFVRGANAGANLW